MSVVSVNRISDPLLDKYDVIDSALIPSKTFTRNFGDTNDYVEAHIYTKDDILLASEYDIKDYTLPAGNTLTTQLIFDPGKYLTDRKYNVGDLKVDYRVYRKKVFTLSSPTFFITEISKDRTEIRLSSNIVSNLTVETGVLNFINEIQTSQYYKDFLLNFGSNKSVNAVNIALDKNTAPYSILVKLYQPLPTEFTLKSSLWIVEELASPIVFEVVLTPDLIPDVVPYLAPPDFDVDVYQHAGLSSPYVNLDTVYSNGGLQAYQNVINELNNDSININVDYTDYKNFVHFSSAQQRLVNFIYKLSEIENYGNDIATLNSIPNQDVSVSGSAQSMQANINNLIKNLDGYESYLYYNSSSFAWPKVGTSLCSVTSSQAATWVGDGTSYGQMYTASLFDTENQDNLVFSVPGYLAEDPRNAQYLVFLNMIGQHFDSIWVYIKAINDIHKAENAMMKGISKDMVYTALRSLGIKLYNNNANQDIYSYLIGNTGSYSVTGSGDSLSGQDQTKELYKRIYNNLPYLLKSKGTTRGIQNLITVFGIPDTILSPIEYGGSDKTTSTKEYVYDRFSYSLSNTTGSYVQLLWGPLTQTYLKYGVSSVVPNAIEFRIKPDKNTYANNAVLLQCYNSGSNSVKFGVTMNYTSSQGISSANFNLIVSGSTGFLSSSLCLPVYVTGSDGDTEFYNVSVGPEYNLTFRSTNNPIILTVQNSISGRIGHTATASLNYIPGGYASTAWKNYGSLNNPNYLTVGGPRISNSIFSQSFAGQIQELRYWSEPLLTSTLNVHTLNNESIQGNTLSGSYNDLAARFPLGNNLVTYNHHLTQSVQSVHPNWGLPYSSGSVLSGSGGSLYGVIHYGTGSYGQPITQSLLYSSSMDSAFFYNYPNTNNYKSEYELCYANTPNAGYYSPVTEKVRVIDNTPQSDVLSPFLKLETPDLTRSSDVHFTEVSLSPQNNINKDITAQLGDYLDLDQYIGDPTYQGLNHYPDIVNLNNQYYQKFKSKYNYKDYVNLVSQIDNTLFKMIFDLAPANVNLSTGITIKSPILERNKVKRHQPSFTQTDYTASVHHGHIEGSSDNLTGEYTGSFLDIHDNFETRNYNPYLLYTASLNKNSFHHSDFDVTAGDVYNNRLSEKFKKLDETTGVLDSVELQDSEYNHTRYTNPRYNGSKVSVAQLNNYTKGDDTYGTTSGVNSYVGKFGYVFQGGMNNLNIPDKTSITLRYLFDYSGSATTLTRANKNIFEVQNTFRSGDSLVVSLADPLNPSNQFSINGTGSVFLGGYSIHPIVYRESNDSMIFTYLNPVGSITTPIGFKAVMTSSLKWQTMGNADVSMDTTPNYGNTVGPHFIINGSANSNPISYPKDSVENFVSKYPNALKLNTDTTKNYFGWQWYYKDINSLIQEMSYYQQYQFDGFKGVYELNYFLTNDFTQGFKNPSSISDNISIEGGSVDSYSGHIVYTVPRSSTYNISANIPISYVGNNYETGCGIFKVVGIVDKSSDGGVTWSYLTNTHLGNYTLSYNQDHNNNLDYSGIDDGSFYNEGVVYIWDRVAIPFTFNQVINNSPCRLIQGDKIRLKVYLIDLSNFFQGSEDMQFNIQAGGFFEVVDAINSITSTITTQSFASGKDAYSMTSSYIPGYQDTMVFDPSMSLWYNNTIFTEDTNFSGSYSPVSDIFTVQPNDLVRLNSINQIPSNLYTVTKVIQPILSGSTVSQPLQVVLNQVPPSGSASGSFAILRPVPDETSVIINKTKQQGIVSSGVLIPEYLDPNVTSNVSNIITPLTGTLLPQ